MQVVCVTNALMAQASEQVPGSLSCTVVVQLLSEASVRVRVTGPLPALPGKREKLARLPNVPVEGCTACPGAEMV